MEYSFIRTINGPVIVGDNEVLFLEQREILDYIDSDPDFFPKAKMFLAEAIREYSAMVIDHLHGPVVGAELAFSLPKYIEAANKLVHAEMHYNSTRFPKE